MEIKDGTGSGRKAGVNSDFMLEVKAVAESQAEHLCHAEGKTYTLVVEDTGPVATEYPLYLKYTGDDQLIIDRITISNTDADVVWKLHEVTGTAAGAAVVTAINGNLASGEVSDTTCRGGAGGVTGLTSASVLAEVFGGAAMHAMAYIIDGSLVLGKNKAIAVEYDAGTGGKIAITVAFHEHAD